MLVLFFLCRELEEDEMQKSLMEAMVQKGVCYFECVCVVFVHFIVS